MTRTRFSLRAAALAALALTGGAGVVDTAAAADDARWYGAVQAGPSRLTQWPAQVNLGGGVRADGGLSLGQGPALGLQLGREQGRWRVALEGQQGRLALQGITLGSQQAAADGRVRYQAVTVNAEGRLALAADWQVYAGLGLGWGRVDLPQAGFGASGCHCFADADGSGRVWQWRAGLEWQATADNRVYLQAGRLHLPGAQGTPASGPSVQYPARAVGQVVLGWRHLF